MLTFWLMLLGISICLRTFFVGLTAYYYFQKQATKLLVVISLIGIVCTVVTYYYFHQALLTPAL